MPPTPAKQMTKALKAHLVPALEAAGLEGRFPGFRRRTETEIHFLSILYDKAGAHFCLEFGAHPPGELATTWGEVVPEEELALEYVPCDERARLQAVAGTMSMAEDWFPFGDLDGPDGFAPGRRGGGDAPAGGGVARLGRGGAEPQPTSLTVLP